MILIKDRHASGECIITSMLPSGKYDTYKGSTLIRYHYQNLTLDPLGKYDTYKGSTRKKEKEKKIMAQIGKYDTYKGSTPVEPHSEHNPNISGGNMILIKDRHTVFFLN